jgi:hypothetical protein
MRYSLLIASVLLLGACEKQRIVEALPIPPDRMDCRVIEGGRPALPAEYVIDWSKVTTVPQARAEHDKFVASVRDREGKVAGYLLEVEGRLFACSNDAAWLREFTAGVQS